MASNLPYPTTLASPVAGAVLNPALAQNNDGNSALAAIGRNGDLLATEIHGPYYHAVARGRVFSAGANDFTGRTILAPGGTTSGFMFYNPVGSGVNMEVLEILVSPLTATDVVGVIGLEFGAPPTTVANAATVRNQLISGTQITNKCLASYGSTIVAMTFLKWFPQFIQTTAGVLQGSFALYNPWGTIVIAPGGAINIVSNNSQSTNLYAQSVVWAEWPV